MVGFPITYGDKNVDEVMLSDYVVELMKTKRFQSHVTAMFFAFLALGMYAQPSSAIPPEYGEAAQNGAAGGIPAAPPIGDIKGHVPNVPGGGVPERCFIPAMPIEQQRLIATQQMGGMPPTIDRGGPTNPPSFFIPGKPGSVGIRAANTVAFTTALGVICLNAAWGEPVAILMCSSGLVGLAYKLGQEIILFMTKNIK